MEKELFVFVRNHKNREICVVLKTKEQAGRQGKCAEDMKGDIVGDTGHDAQQARLHVNQISRKGGAAKPGNCAVAQRGDKSVGCVEVLQTRDVLGREVQAERAVSNSVISTIP